MDQETRFKVFFGAWVLLGLGSLLLFRSNIDPKVKRRWVILINSLAPILFCGFVFWTSNQPKVLVFVAPAAAVIAILNIRIMKVCEKCGSVQMMRSVIFQAAKFCSRCRAPLDKGSIQTG